nr:glycine radical domain-containing protein [Serratia entomophila]
MFCGRIQTLNIIRQKTAIILTTISSTFARNIFNSQKTRRSRGWEFQSATRARQTLSWLECCEINLSACAMARQHPDLYRDLVVRVAGYSAFFTALSPDAQDDIIARTEHTL